MKKLVYLLIAVSLVLALVPTVALAHTVDDPLVVDLLAGQTDDIGDVKVWNDGTNLYVQFLYTGPECGFLELHLQVDEGTWSEDILTKKGNPIPGQFEESYKPGWCFNEHTFAFDLSDEGFEVGDTLMIAAHAALGLEESMTIVSDTSTAVTEVNGTPVTANAVLANEPVGYPNCASYAPDGTGSAWDSSVNIPGAHWIWNTLNPEQPIQGDVVTFNKAFTVPGMPNGGTLYITADNGYEVTLNGIPLGSAQLGPGFPTTLKETTDTTPQAGNWGVASQGWQSVESYALTELVSGENTLVIIAANEYMWNTTDQYQGKDYYYGSWDPSGGSVNPDPFPGYGIGVDNICRNPGGLIFKATLDYYASGETAWGCRDPNCFDFGGKNWATYFMYTVQEVPPCPQITDHSYVETADGGILEILGTPLDDVSAGQDTSENARVFLEYVGDDHGGFKLDINNANQTNAVTPPGDGFSVDSGTPVCSYYVHFDDGDYTEPGYDVLWASLTFEKEIIGLIVAGTINTNDIFFKKGINTLCATDAALGAVGTTYPAPGGCGINGDARGLEIFNADPTLSSNQDPVQISGNTIEFNPLIANKHDSFRIILPANYVP